MAAAEQSFMDELAELAGKDPIAFRLELLQRAKDKPVGKSNEYEPERYAEVLRLVRDKSGWGKPENAGKKRGVSAYFCHDSYAAHVLDLEMEDGTPVVQNVVCAVDCGIVINPDGAKNLSEGGIVDGIGAAMFGKMTIEKGVPQSSNFDTYRMIRHHEAPKKIEVHFVKNEIDPTGMGEPAYPPVFGALANALYQATGKRHYRQPFSDNL
jgi:isoquinoline 1-oxidoreductase beta subunit